MENKQVKKSTKRKEPKGPSKVNLLDKRILYINTDIEGFNSSCIVEALLKIDNTKGKNEDITIYINSPGGSVPAGLAIYDAMQMVKSDIKTICIGHCASMAAVLLSGGTKGKRFITKNSEVMIHEVSTFSMGKMEKVKNDLEHSNKVNEKVLQILANNTGQPLKKITKDTLKDKWFSSQEAIEYGLCDKILS